MKHKKFITLLAALLAVFVLLSNGADAADASSSELKAQLEALEKEKDAIDSQLGALQDQYRDNQTELADMVNQKANLDQQIFLLNQQISNTESQIATYRVLIADKQVELEEAQAHLMTLNELYKDRIRTMEEDGRVTYWSVLFKANSFSDLLDRLSIIQEIAAADQRRLQELRDAAKLVSDAKAELQAGKDDLEQIQAEQQASIEQLDKKRAEAEKLLDELVDRGEEYEDLIHKSEDLQEQLAMDIAQAEKDYDAAKYREWLATSVPPTTKPPPTTVPPTTAPKPTEAPDEPTSAPTEAPTEPPETTAPAVTWRSPLLRSTYVTSPYGMRFHPVQNVWRMHHGVDLYSFQGDPIVATRGGVVTVASYQEGGAGYYVTINHGDGFSSTYMHMTNYIVEKGDYVSQGQTIGYVGSTGGSTGPHLHFGIFKDGSSVNPVDYVKFS